LIVAPYLSASCGTLAQKKNSYNIPSSELFVDFYFETRLGIQQNNVKFLEYWNPGQRTSLSRINPRI
jgi:hypothetical protein